MNTISFVDKVKSLSKDNLYLIKGFDKGLECWYYVDVPRLAAGLFSKEAVKGANINLEKYGKVIVSGWGSEPYPHILDRIEEFGSSYKPEEDEEWRALLDSKSDIYFVQASDVEGRDFHAYVAVEGIIADKFIEDANRGDIDINTYGTIVFTDWGRPSDETRKYMTETYGVNHDLIDANLEKA